MLPYYYYYINLVTLHKSLKKRIVGAETVMRSPISLQKPVCKKCFFVANLNRSFVSAELESSGKSFPIVVAASALNQRQTSDSD